MKSFLVAAVVFGIQFSAQAAKIACAGKTEDMSVQFTAHWVPGADLTDLEFIGSGGHSRTFATAPLLAYRPRNPAYAMMNRFLLTSDGWSTTSILLPQNPPTSSGFQAYFYDQGHSGTGTIPLRCSPVR
jgi:hypothetical protein